MSETPRAEAIVTCALAVLLLVTLGVRDDFALPNPPELPAQVVTVSGATAGAEDGPSGPFWTIDGDYAVVTVQNATADAATASIRFRLLDGPCGRGQQIALGGDAPPEVLELPAADFLDVSVDVDIAAFGSIDIEARPAGPRCDPVGADPRSIAFQVYDLVVSR